MKRQPTRKEREAWGAFVSNAMKPEHERDHVSTEAAVAALVAHSEQKSRAKPRRLEESEQRALTGAAALMWWYPGYRHHAQERESRTEAWRLAELGVKPGWPDVTLHIPRLLADNGNSYRSPVLLALELKAEKGRPTAAQLACLHSLELCGYATKVAWGWREAFEWLDVLAGPRPAVLPDGWADRDDLA